MVETATCFPLRFRLQSWYETELFKVYSSFDGSEIKQYFVQQISKEQYRNISTSDIGYKKSRHFGPHFVWLIWVIKNRCWFNNTLHELTFTRMLHAFVTQHKSSDSCFDNGTACSTYNLCFHHKHIMFIMATQKIHFCLKIELLYGTKFSSQRMLAQGKKTTIGVHRRMKP